MGKYFLANPCRDFRERPADDDNDDDDDDDDEIRWWW